jgi:hypothetical protein
MPSKLQMMRSSAGVGFFFLLGGLTGILVEAGIAAKTKKIGGWSTGLEPGGSR